MGNRDARGRHNGRAATTGGGLAAGRQGSQRRAAPVPGVAAEATAPSTVSPSTGSLSRRDRGRGPVVAVTGAATAARRVSRVVAVAVTVTGQAEAKGRVSHLRPLSGRMEGSTSATLSGSNPR